METGKKAITIGDRTFLPRSMGLWEKIKMGVLDMGMSLATDLLYDDNRQFTEVKETFRLAVYYGREAADSFEAMVEAAKTVPILSTTELTFLNTCHNPGRAQIYREQLMEYNQAVYNRYFAGR